MISIIKKEIDVEESLRKRLEIICDFCNTTPTIINGSIRKVDKTNLFYIESHKIIINNNVFIAFNYSNEIYINNLSKKIKINELENILKAKIKSILCVNTRQINKMIIKDLKEESLSLRQSLSFWKDKFLKVISFIKDKLFGKEKELEKYMDVVEDLYSKKIIEEDTFEDLQDTYEFSKNHDYERKKDDFDLSI